MRGEVRVAIKASSALSRKVKREEAESFKASKGKQKAVLSQKSDVPSSSLLKPTNTPKPSPAPASKEKPGDFERLSTSAPRRLNDIVQAPPELKKLPRGAKQQPKISEAAVGGEGTATLRQGALSMAQKAMLEEERLKAIKLYREMKKAKTVE